MLVDSIAHATSRLILNHYITRRFPDPPIFIGGAPRSGTTLLISILSAHPHIHAIDYETAAFYPDFRPEKLVSALLLEPGNRGLRRIDSGKRRYCEKTPGNIRNTDAIFAFFKTRVRCINIFRDGRDVVTSRHPEAPDRYWLPVRRWVQDVKFGLEAEKKGIALSIRYEDLVAAPEHTVKRVCDYIDEPFSANLLRYQASNSTISNMAKTAWNRDPEAINTNSIRKWEKPEHRERLEEFYRSKDAVRLLSELGYS